MHKTAMRSSGSLTTAQGSCNAEISSLNVLQIHQPVSFEEKEAGTAVRVHFVFHYTSEVGLFDFMTFNIFRSAPLSQNFRQQSQR